MILDKLGRKNGKHGLYSNPLYVVWRNMLDRCYNKKNISYKNYGGRGISVCDEWRKSVVPFHKWCVDNGWEKGLQLDRINNDGNYEPSNCRCVSPKENMRNRSSNRILEINGERKTLIEWAEQVGLKQDAIFRRLEDGWSVYDAVFKPKTRADISPQKLLKAIHVLRKGFHMDCAVEESGLSAATIRRNMVQKNGKWELRAKLKPLEQRFLNPKTT